MSIPEPKVAHHHGRGIRSCPIFPELRLILDEAFEIFGSESEYVVAHPGFRAAANTPDGLEELEPQNRAYATPAPRRRVTLATTIPLDACQQANGAAARVSHPRGLLLAWQFTASCAAELLAGDRGRFCQGGWGRRG